MRAKKYFLMLFIAGLISWPTLTEAGQGCCSWHGGQSYCDTSVGRWVCSDGTYSPSCGCTYIAPKATTTPSAPTKSVLNLLQPKEDLKQNEIDELKKQNSDLSSKLKEAEDHFIDAYQYSKNLEKALLAWITALLILSVSGFYAAKENETAGSIFGLTFFVFFIYLMATGFQSLATIIGVYKDFLF